MEASREERLGQCELLKVRQKVRQPTRAISQARVAVARAVTPVACCVLGKQEALGADGPRGDDEQRWVHFFPADGLIQRHQLKRASNGGERHANRVEVPRIDRALRRKGLARGCHRPREAPARPAAGADVSVGPYVRPGVRRGGVGLVETARCKPGQPPNSANQAGKPRRRIRHAKCGQQRNRQTRGSRKQGADSHRHL